MRRQVSAHTPSAEVSRQLDNTAYDNVKVVAAAIDSVISVGGALDNGDMDTVTTNIDDILLVAGLEVEILSLVADKLKLDSLYADKTTLDTIFASIANIDAVALDLTNVGIVADDIASVVTTATNMADVLATSGSIANVNIVAQHIDNVNTYADTYYGPKASEPITRNDSTAMVIGDMYFNTVTGLMKVYTGALWINSGSVVNGTSERYVYAVGTPSGDYDGVSSDTFPAIYDAGFVDVYVEGIKLVPIEDFTATNGSTITTTAALPAGLDVEIIGYSAFDLTNAAQIKTMYESNADTNEFSDAEQLKLEEFKLNDISITNKIGNPAHIDTLTEVYNHIYSSGIMSGCDLTDNGNGTIDIATGTGMLRAPGDNGHGTLYSAEIPAVAGLSLVDGQTNYVYISYNDGVTLLWATTTSTLEVNLIDKIPVYIVVRSGNSIGYLDIRNQNVNHIAKAQSKEFYTNPFARKNGGAIISDAGTLHLACTAGAFYFQLDEYALPALNTTGVDTFKYYSHIAGNWVETDASVIDTINYDNGTDLVALGNNKYGVHWVYGILGNNPKHAVVYGTQEYANIAEAQSSSAPSVLPPSIQGLGVLLGKVLVEKAATELSDVETVFETSFTSTLATNHENLAGLLGGAIGDHVHLTTDEHTDVVSIVNGIVPHSLEVQGNFTVSGSTTTVDSTTVTTADNLIVINNGEVGTGVTNGEAGIQIDRGLATNYEFKFDEVDDSFKIGEVGSLQKVATREEIPTDTGVAIWDNATSKFNTTLTPTITSANVTGNITVGGTVDGRDIAADGTTLDNIGTYLEFTTAYEA